MFDAINPLGGALYQSTQLQEQQSADKQRTVRRAQALTKDVAAKDDELEHQVESAEELPQIHDQEQKQEQKRDEPQKQTPDQQPDHLDLTA